MTMRMPQRQNTCSSQFEFLECLLFMLR